MIINLLYATIGAAFGWSAAMLIVWLRDGGIVDFFRVRFVDNDGEAM